jgi:two-component system sensor histidine kinase NreB
VSDTLISFPLELPDGVSGIVTVIDREDGLPFGPDDLGVLEQLTQFYASTYETPARREALRLRSELRALRKESIRAAERERQRLSRELHDDVGHALTTAILGIDMQWQRLPNSDGSRDALIAAREALTQCADHLHEFAFHLRPVVLQDLGLTPALRSLARRVSETGAVDAQVVVYGQERRVTDDVELAAFRIVQEALTNALKHAQASRITSKVTFTEESLELVISDDGVGFPSMATEIYWGRNGQGIAGMRERAELVGGYLDVVSQKESGTEIWALLPIVENGHD